MTLRSVAMNIDSGEKTWLTPPHIVEALGPFDLDPCCPPNMPWRTATQMVCRPDDGLAVDWTGKRVWCNPPYGREAVPFLRKMAEHEGGYRARLRKDGHLGVAGTRIPRRAWRPVPSRSAPLPQGGRNARRDGYSPFCARRVFGTRLCPSARKRACRGIGDA